MTPELSTLLAILGAGMLVIAGGVYWWISRTPRIERLPDEPLPLFGGLTPEERMRSPSAPSRAVVSSVAAAAPSMPAAAPKPAPTRMGAPEPPRPEPPRPEAPRPAPVIREFVTGGPTLPSSVPKASDAAPTAADYAVMSGTGVPGTMVEGHTLRFSVPAEGTLQFLPGRLEIGAGLDAGREIRFVKVDGPNGVEVTFGRSDGELYRHIQLRDKTVSRTHARLHWHEGVWRLQNLSHTNPVVYNGVEMAGDAIQLLSDGDRVEMGEVLFTYRSR